MKVALIQSNPLTGALQANMRALEEALAGAAGFDVDLCVAPELALCGHNAGDLLLRPAYVEQCRLVLHEAATRLGAVPSLPPLLLGAPVANPVPIGNRVQSCAVLLHQGKVTVVGRKVLLPTIGIHDDARYFEPGVACGVLNLKGWRLCVTIGEDAWNDHTFWHDRRSSTLDPVAEFMAAGGADGLINLTAIPYEQGLPGLHQRLFAHLAARYRVPVAVANLVGGDDSIIYYGGSLCFDGNGRLLARAPSFKESLLVVDLGGKQESSIAEEPDTEEELWQAIVLGIRDFARKCGFSSAVLGLSGGIDSALVAALAAEAFEPENVTALLMPSPYSSRGSIHDSLALARNLGIKAFTLPITPVLKAFEKVFTAEFTGGLAGVAEENIQARIRGSLLMAHANRFGSLLLATANKSEAAVGYSTLYGDLAGGLVPIGDLYKRQIYSLCRWYNSRSPGAIPEDILTKAPSAELRPGQKDSDSLPEYAVLDDILYDMIDKNMSCEQLIEKGYAPAVVMEVHRLLRRSEFKRRQTPPTLHLSKRGFGRGWHFPIAMVGTEQSQAEKSDCATEL